MRAVIYRRYGGPEVLEFVDIPKPVPRDNEVLVRIHATTVSSGDWRMRSLDLPRGFRLLGRPVIGMRGPRLPVLGTELAGVVETVGTGVTRFKAGDKVFAFPGAKMGSHAEYRCIPEDGPIALMPAALGFDEAAALSFGGTTALSFLTRGNIRRGDRVLINGASGSVGTAAIQIARHFGAHVTAVCSSANLELVKELGADAVIDYTRQDFTKGGEKWDIILYTAGTAPWSRSKRALTENGRLLVVLGSLGAMLQAPLVAMMGRRRVIAGPVKERAEDMHFLAKLVEQGELRAVIDRRFPFEQIAEAHRHVDAGHKRGNVVVIVRDG